MQIKEKIANIAIMKLRYCLLLSLISLISSCSELSKETVAALDILDSVIEDEDIYEGRFYEEIDSLKQEIEQAGTDSLKWERMYMLSMRFRHYDIDSASYYCKKRADFQRTAEQVVLDEIQQLHFICYRGQHADALVDFCMIDTTSTCDRIQYRYLIADIGFHRHFHEDEALEASINRLITLFPESHYGIRQRGEELIDKGKYNEAVDFIYPYLNTRDLNLKASLENILADAYAALGARDLQYRYLAKSATTHLRECDRWHYSLSQLSNCFLEDGDSERAVYYISIMNNNSQKGHYYNAMKSSYSFKDTVMKALQETHKRRRYLYEIIILLLLSVLVLALFISASTIRYGRKVHRLNSQLKIKNENLLEANNIRDAYLFRYMLLSSKYIGKLSENRKQMRQIFKKGGVDGLLNYIKMPNYEDDEYKSFFNNFDQAFIKLFPNFIEKVNLLLREDSQIPREEFTCPMSMELRILALIKLGMKSSSDMAVFLNCALSSIYSVRSRCASNSIYSKKDFEEKIENL